MMASKYALLFAFMLFFGVQQETAFTWQPDRNLTWADYQAVVDPNSDAVALTAAGITFSYSLKEADRRFVSFVATAEANFYPESSWYKKDKCNETVLAHEQLHFDIAELHVRMLRAALNDLETTQAIKSDLRRVHRNANRDMAKMQNTYDLETNNSRDVEQQEQWASLVKNELEKYQQFESK
ncbi:DUF922 domain-containing protein [Subsaximicrobium wynnwilliamsii]|nr:DUF922 domain-containing protein [Subsaximicrobium wynnwilliamsii]